MNKRENMTMRVLSALGILFIVCGHIELPFFTIKGIFPYYSFHVYIFLFTAGYFYDPADEESPLKYILKKAKAFLLPYFAFNLFYGILSTILNARGFSIGQNISLYSYFVEPFMGGHQYMLNAPSWFLIALFFTEIVNLFVRIVLSKIHLDNEYLIACLYLVLGIITVFLAIGGHVWGPYKDIGRILIMLPGFAIGRLYKDKIEKFRPSLDTFDGLITNLAVLVLVFIIQMIIVRFCAGLSFSTVWVTGYANGPLIPFVTIITGIVFWYLVSDIIVYVLSIKDVTKKALDVIGTVGRSTRSIMLHHIFIVFIINSLISKMYMSGHGFKHFDMDAYLSDAYYVYGRGITDAPKWFYMVLCIAVPILLSFVFKNVKKMILPATAVLLSMLIMTGCQKDVGSQKAEPYVAKDYVSASEETGAMADGMEVATNPDDSLSVPTYITKIDGLYFIVDCYHNRVLYSETQDAPLYTWNVMTDEIDRGHTVASDGEVYLVDDTENNRILVFEKGTGADGTPAFAMTQVFNDIGQRPHYIIYDERTDTFYAWSSLTGEMFLFRHEEGNSRMYLTKVMSIPELNGFYVRSFTIEGDRIFFVSGNSNIIEADLQSFEIKNRYPVDDRIAGMVQLTRIEDYYYITVSTDISANQDAATIIRTKDLNSLQNGEWEDIYDIFVGGGTPYCITKIDDTYYLCEHRLPGHSIWSFKVRDNEICDVVSLF